MQKAKRIRNLFLMFQQKRLGEVKNVQLLDVLTHSATVKAHLLAYIFLSFPHCNRWCNLIKSQNNKDEFSVSSNTVLCHHHFTEKDIKKSFLIWKFLPGSFPSQNLPDKTTTPKQERKLPVRQQITVKSTPKRTQKTSLSITSPLALPLLNYEEPMTKDVGTQTNNTLFELLNHDYSLYHTDYSKNIK